ncbi:hypothetical protein CK203_019136 [Vitis vinifera]|uniref:Uncharacterized protein n=1 Tax=Vitis vinifera TaxID=29760 RepID=A0A438J7Z0_VITVI|nr:hypothetical protein CK203_019136 [Vitis vinifera]
MERGREVGVLVLQEKVMGWVFGRPSRMDGWSLEKGWLLRWGMGDECNSRRIGGMERIP